MKNYFCLVGLCVSLFSMKSPLFSQEIFPWQSSISQIGSEAWGAGGAYIARKGLSSAAFLNPASLEATGFSIYTEFGKMLETDFFSGGRLDNQFILPGFVAVSIPINKLVTSLGYANSYNFRFESDINSITIPDGTGAILVQKLESKIHTFFGSLKYKLNKHAEFGLTATANYVTDDEDLVSLQKDGNLGSLQKDGNGLGLGFIAGGIITMSESVAFGIGAKYKHEINYDTDISGSLINTDLIDVDRGTSPLIIPFDNRVRVKFPWSLQAGVTYMPTPSFSISVMFDYQHWSFADERLENEFQFHVGTDFQLSHALDFSLGFFTMDNPDDELFLTLINQNFLTAGISLKIMSQLKLSVSVLDAHLLTDNDFQQTYIMAGLQYGLE